jgi:hypothetical protein
MTSPTSGASFLLALAIACGDAPATVPPERMTTGAETTTGGTTDGTTAVPGPDACEASEDCGEGFCVAPYDAGTSVRGAAACVSTCVEADDLQRWCIDDAACCEGFSCSAVDGFCVGGAVDGSSSSGTGTSTGTQTSSSSSEGGSGSESSSSSSSTTMEATR